MFAFVFVGAVLFVIHGTRGTSRQHALCGVLLAISAVFAVAGLLVESWSAAPSYWLILGFAVQAWFTIAAAAGLLRTEADDEAIRVLLPAPSATGDRRTRRHRH